MRSRHCASVLFAVLLFSYLFDGATAQGLDEDEALSDNDDNDDACPTFDIVKLGLGASGSIFGYHELKYGPARAQFPSVLVLDTGEDPHLYPQPKTAPAQPYTIGQPNTRYIYTAPTTNNPLGSFLLHTAEKIAGGAQSIGDGIYAGPDVTRLNSWMNYADLARYAKFAENCPACTLPDRGHNGAIDIVHFWPRRGMYEDLLQNASTVFGVDLHEDLHRFPGVLVGDQNGILAADGSVNRSSITLKFLSLANTYPQYKILFGATVTSLAFARHANKIYVSRVYYEYQGTTMCARPKRVHNSLGWLRTVEVAKRSGVGPAAELAQLGIPSVLDLPNFGRFYGDAQSFYMTWLDTNPARNNATWLPTAVFASSGSYPGQIDAEVPFLVYPRSFTGSPYPLIITPVYISSTVYQGYISLLGKSPFQPSYVAIDFGLNSTAAPMLHTIDFIVKKARQLMAMDPSFVEVSPGAALPQNYTLQQLLTYVTASLKTLPQTHTSQVTPAGQSVVSINGRWNDIANLRETGALNSIMHMEGHPLWTLNALSTKWGCQSAVRIGGAGCPVPNLAASTN